MQWRCSGTLLSSTLFLTAGHCTESPAAHVEIWFDSDVESGIPGNGYPIDGDAGGTPYTHPQYDPNAFNRYDLGVVVLDEPFERAEYGALPQQDVLDTLATRRGTKDVTFTAVGYGLQKSFPDAASFLEQADRVRMLARPHLVQINTGLTGDGSRQWPALAARRGRGSRKGLPSWKLVRRRWGVCAVKAVAARPRPQPIRRCLRRCWGWWSRPGVGIRSHRCVGRRCRPASWPPS